MMDSVRQSESGDFQRIVPTLNNNSSDDVELGELNFQPAPRRIQISSEELEALKPVIMRLYIDQRLSFNEVRKVLATKYNYNPTKRQFSRLREKWGMMKNTKLGDRYKLLENIEAGRVSAEGVSGTVSLNIEKIERWRKQIGGRTTSVSKESLQRSRENTARTKTSSRDSSTVHGQFYRASSAGSIITRQPTAPDKFRVTEGLLFSIDTYITGMYDQRAWLPVDDSGVQDKSFDSQLKILDQFYSGCMTAFNFVRTNKFIEARRVLSGACGLIRDIIVAGHPDTLNYLLDTFHDLTLETSEPFSIILNLLRDYIARLAMIVLPEKHPWRDICCLLGRTDIGEFDKTVVLSMRSVADVLGRKGGKFSSSSVWSRVMCIEWVHANSLRDGEAALRKFIADIRAASISHPEIFVVMKYLATNVRRQGRLQEYETIGKEYVNIARLHGTTTNLVVGLLITAMSQYFLGNISQAEAYQREAVKIRLTQSDAKKFTWAIHHLGTLRSWFLEWGRIADAEKIEREIESLIEHDTAGENDLVDLM